MHCQGCGDELRDVTRRGHNSLGSEKSQMLSSIQCICFVTTAKSNMGVPNLLLARVPSDIITHLHTVTPFGSNVAVKLKPSYHSRFWQIFCCDCGRSYLD